MTLRLDELVTSYEFSKMRANARSMNYSLESSLTSKAPLYLLSLAFKLNWLYQALEVLYLQFCCTLI